MQTLKQQNSVNKFISVIVAFSVVALSGLTHAEEAIADLAYFDAADKWQTNRLFKPTINQRKKEKQGKVMIYDGLRDKTVKAALDRNFDRIENMMFTRVVITDVDGNPQVDDLGNELVEDDGC